MAFVVPAGYLLGDISKISLTNHPDLAHLQTPQSQGQDILTFNIPSAFIGSTTLMENVSPRIYNSMYLCGHTNFTGKLLVNDIEVWEFTPERPHIEGIVLIGRRQLGLHNITLQVTGGGTINFDVQFVTIKI